MKYADMFLRNLGYQAPFVKNRQLRKELAVNLKLAHVLMIRLSG